jgi:hypothetical protein
VNTIMTREKRNGSICFCCLVILPLASLLVPIALAQDTVTTLNLTRAPIVGSSPVTESFIVTMPLLAVPPAPPNPPPVAVVILLSGGTGNIQLTPPAPPAIPDSTLSINSNNFLTRSRWLFGGYNFIVITVDAASDYLQMPPNYLQFHQGDPQHVRDIEQVLLFARSTLAGLPVWVVGTSRGTAGAFLAAVAGPPPAGPDGLVFSSAINGNTPPPLDPDSLFSATLSSITVPVLLLNDAGNTCPNTLPSGDAAVKKALTSSLVVEIKSVAASTLLPLTDNCHALSSHGYFAVEDHAVKVIADWIISH